MPSPSGEQTQSSAATRLSRFARLSPIPITTRFVSLSPSGSKFLNLSTCSTISPFVRFRSTPFSPLAQKTHPIPQPTCVLTQTVLRSSSAINTHSIFRPSWHPSNSFSVPSGATSWCAIFVAKTDHSSSSSRLNRFGRSDIASNVSARLSKTHR